MLKSWQRGDTLIEVMVAFSIFSLVVVGALAVMNQGSYVAERSVETTVVRQEINSQAEALRFLHDSYVAQYTAGETYDPNATSPANEWLHLESLIDTNATSATDLTAVSNSCPTPPSNNSFVLDSRNAQVVAGSSGKLVPATTYAQLTYDTVNGQSVLNQAQGIWIEPIRSATNSTDPSQAHLGYIDFYIEACWVGEGQTVPMTLETIVRLYEPR